MHEVEVGSIVRMRPDNDDLSYVAGIVGIATTGSNGEFKILANAWQFSPHVSYEICPINSDEPEVREIWACAHEFTVIG